MPWASGLNLSSVAELTAEGHRWALLAQPLSLATDWHKVHLRHIGRGRPRKARFTMAYSPTQGRLARCKEERRLHADRPALWQATNEALAAWFASRERVLRLLAVLSDTERRRVLATLTVQEAARLAAVLGEVGA
jgi:hypothetical protein